MTALNREQLERDCADAFEALTKEQRLDGLVELADSLRTLGPPYRFHGELMQGAVRDGQENAITWHLIHVLEQLERDTYREALNGAKAESSRISQEEGQATSRQAQAGGATEAAQEEARAASSRSQGADSGEEGRPGVGDLWR
jgi:hypothetical protein